MTALFARIREAVEDEDSLVFVLVDEVLPLLCYSLESTSSHLLLTDTRFLTMREGIGVSLTDVNGPGKI